MIISMYYPIFDRQDCIGDVGAGVYASQLMDVQLDLDIEGLPHSEYVFLMRRPPRQAKPVRVFPWYLERRKILFPIPRQQPRIQEYFNECIQSIKTLMDEIATASVQQSDLLEFLFQIEASAIETLGRYFLT